MTSASQISIVARRELLERGRSPIFRISMVVMVLLIVGGVVLVSFFGGTDDPIPAGITGEEVPGLEDALVMASDQVGEEIDVTSYPDEAAGEAAIESGEIDFLIVDGQKVVTQSTISSTDAFITSTAIKNAALSQMVESGEIAADDISTVLSPVEIDFVEMETPDPAEDARSFFAFFSGLLLFVTIMMFGQFVAMGIVEEKQNRVVEVVISRIEPTSLLIGKVLGIGALGLAQVGVFALAGIIALLVVPGTELPDIDLSAIGIPALIWVVVWFILGYLLYSFLYAGLGATVSRQEELQGVAFIPALFLMPAYFIASFSLGSGVPAIAVWGSLFPLWAPILMPLRITTGDVALWEIVLSLALVCATIVVTLWIATRIYRGAALRTGGKVKITEAFRDART